MIRKILQLLPDKQYIELKYLIKEKKFLNLNKPKGFNEKMQWLKLYDRKPIYTTMVDKYNAKKFVADKIGEEYIIKVIGKWNSFDEIDFDSLPNQFVLKTNHDSGGVVICKDKSNFDIEAARTTINNSLKRNYYYHGREWPYKNVKPMVFAEEYIVDDKVKSDYKEILLDYKFYCFNGEPKFLYVSDANFRGNSKHDLLTHYNIDFTKSEFQRYDHDQLPYDVEKPKNYETMVEIVTKLSKDIPFVRVDLFCANNKIYFSEFTFSPGSGFTKFKPEKYDGIFGSYITVC